MNPDDVLEFWFGPAGSDPYANASKWWKKDPDFDAEIREHFGSALEAAARGELDGWRDEARSCIAFIILIDQFSRNIHRGSAESFAADHRALEACTRGMERGLDAELSPAERTFFYMPLMHAEDLDAQNRCIIALATLTEELPEDQRARTLQNVVFAVKHQKIVKRFGRFPHRNAILGRESTPEEVEFLKQPGSSF